MNIRYVALGDSYTICEGVKAEERWPNIMCKKLEPSTFKLDLVANPSVTGWTTRDLIENELSIARAARPDFFTLLIGVNDWVQQVPAEIFERNLSYILDECQSYLRNRKNLVLITIPDFSGSTEGPKYNSGRDIQKGLQKFNTIIKNQAAERGLEVADIFPTSLAMHHDKSLMGSDGLHPSAKEYANWEEIIRPVVAKVLT